MIAAPHGIQGNAREQKSEDKTETVIVVNRPHQHHKQHHAEDITRAAGKNISTPLVNGGSACLQVMTALDPVLAPGFKRFAR